MTAEKQLTLEERYHRHVAKKPYNFPWNGRDWTLPHMASLDYRLQNRIAKFDTLTMDELEDLFAKLLGPEQVEAWEQTTVPGDYLLMVFTDWSEHSGDEEGEDSASSDSSTNTGTNSRRTSRTTTASGSRSRSSAKPTKKTPAKRAPRKTKPTAAELAQLADAEWLAKHQALAGSPPAN